MNNISAKRLPGKIRLPSELFYFSGDCNDSAVQEKVKESFITSLNTSKYSEFCTAYENCSIENVRVSCGLTSREKRSSYFYDFLSLLTSRTDRQKRNTNSHKLTIQWDITLKINESTLSGLTSQELWSELEGKLEDVAQVLKTETQEGKFDMEEVQGFDLEIDRDSYRTGWPNIVCQEGMIPNDAHFSCCEFYMA